MPSTTFEDDDEPHHSLIGPSHNSSSSTNDDEPHRSLIGPSDNSSSSSSSSSSTSLMSVSFKEGDHKASLGKFTVEDAVEFMGFGTFQALVFVYAGVAWVADAMEMMLLSFVAPAVQKEWNLSPTEESMITSVVFVGMMFGSYLWGLLSDLKGRRCGFLFTALVTFVAGFLTAFSPNYYILLLLRGLVGVGLAGGAVITSWFLEFIPTSNRGLWMVLIGVFWTFGALGEATLAWAVMPSLGWRWLLGLSSVPLLVLLVFYPLVPESPRYLIAKGESDEALEVLWKVARINHRSLPLGHLYQESTVEVQLGKGQLVNEAIGLIKSLFTPSLIRSTLLVWVIFFANAFTYYGLVLLTTQLSDRAVNCGVANNAAHLIGKESADMYRSALVTSFAELPGRVVSAIIVDRLGRKKSMSALFLVCGAVLLPLIHQPLAASTMIFSLFLARACITGTFTIVYIYTPEVYPTQLRTTGLGIANSVARIGGVLCPIVAVELVKSCQLALAIALFVAVPLLGAVAVILLPIETKGRFLTDTVEETNCEDTKEFP